MFACVRGCVYVCLFSQGVWSPCLQEGNGCKPQEWYNDSGRKMQHGIRSMYFVFGYLPVLGKKGDLRGGFIVLFTTKPTQQGTFIFFFKLAVVLWITVPSINTRGGGFYWVKKKKWRLTAASKPTIYTYKRRKRQHRLQTILSHIYDIFTVHHEF